MNRTDSLSGRIALMAAHCAGMVDLVGLPVWVGTLISAYGFDPRRAGLLATLFLVGAVVASLSLAPRFERLSARPIVVAGYAVAALASAGAALTHDFVVLAALHFLAGLSAGGALSVTHGTISRSLAPHRLFASVGMALSLFSVVFLGTTRWWIRSSGGEVLFLALAAVMAIAALTAVWAFPEADAPAKAPDRGASSGRIEAPVWFGVIGIGCMALVQAMTFSFVERVGSDRGFGADAVTRVLVMLGFANLLAALLAALLEKRWRARWVLLLGPVVQAALVAIIMNSRAFAPYALATGFFSAVMILSHTFGFGLLAQLDKSGRALAATPAMLMIGAAIGPVLGGTLVEAFGYGQLGVAALLIDGIAVICFFRLPGRLPRIAIEAAKA